MWPENKSNSILIKSLVTLQTFHSRIPLHTIDSVTPNTSKLFYILDYNHCVCIVVVFKLWLRDKTCELVSETKDPTLQSTTSVVVSKYPPYSTISSASTSTYSMMVGSSPPSMWKFLKSFYKPVTFIVFRVVYNWNLESWVEDLLPNAKYNCLD